MHDEKKEEKNEGSGRSWRETQCSQAKGKKMKKN
jgi:hypothetical protein